MYLSRIQLCIRIKIYYSMIQWAHRATESNANVCVIYYIVYSINIFQSIKCYFNKIEKSKLFEHRVKIRTKKRLNFAIFLIASVVCQLYIVTKANYNSLINKHRFKELPNRPRPITGLKREIMFLNHVAIFYYYYYSKF